MCSVATNWEFVGSWVGGQDGPQSTGVLAGVLEGFVPFLGIIRHHVTPPHLHGALWKALGNRNAVAVPSHPSLLLHYLEGSTCFSGYTQNVFSLCCFTILYSANSGGVFASS